MTMAMAAPPTRLPVREANQGLLLLDPIPISTLAGAGRIELVASRDPDIHKGAMEDDRPCATTNAPGLDDDGLPNDEIAIAEDALGAREDGSQG